MMNRSHSAPTVENRRHQAGEGQARTLLHVIQEVAEAVRKGHPADAALGRIFRENRQFGARDRRLYTNTVFSFYRWKGWLDGPSDAPSSLSCVYASLLDEETVHPAIAAMAAVCGIPPDNLIPLGAKTISDKGVALARILNRARPFIQDTLIPDWAGSHMTPIHDPDSLIRYVESFQARPPTWLRVRPTEKDRIIRRLTDLGHIVCPHPVFHEAVRMDTAIGRNKIHAPDMPYFEIQDLASQCVGAICDPQPGQAWWDACAGAGGKSLHLAERMHSKGSVLATDIRSGALRELLLRSRRMQTELITPLCLDEYYDTPKDAMFDGVLVDAPCSGLGTWSRSPDARWRTKAEDPIAWAAQQRDLLDYTAHRVQPGGALVYAVCTLTSCETIEQARSFEHAHPNFEPAPFMHPLTGQPMCGTAWIHPWDGPCGAMFVTRWKKKQRR